MSAARGLLRSHAEATVHQVAEREADRGAGGEKERMAG